MIYTGPGPTQYGVGPNNFGNNPYYQQGIPGYMPGYYNGNYNMYNPYAYQEMMRQQQEAYNKEMKKQQDLANRLNRASFVYNETNSPEIVRDVYRYTKEQLADIQKYNQECIASQRIGGNYHATKKNKSYMPSKKVNHLINMNKQKQYDDSIMPPDADLFYFMENGYKITYDIVEREKKEKEQNLKQLYNQQSYQQLLNMHNNVVGYQQNYDNIQPISLDDMEVSLPSNLRVMNDYQRRREQFLQELMKRQGQKNG